MTLGRAPSGAQPSTWLQSATVEVYLPSGTRVRLMLPSLRHLIRHGLLPTHLHEAALRGADPKWVGEPEKREERQASISEYLCWLISWAVREVEQDGEQDGEWLRARLSPGTVAELAPDDRDTLEDVVLRDRTPAEASHDSRVMRLRQGLPVPEEPPDDGEVAIPGWADFRGERGGAASGDDSAAMADAPEPAAVGGG